MRAQLGIEDDILRGLGMCLQQAKCARVCTRALLANLRFMNYGQVYRKIDRESTPNAGFPLSLSTLLR